MQSRRTDTLILCKNRQTDFMQKPPNRHPDFMQKSAKAYSDFVFISIMKNHLIFVSSDKMYHLSDEKKK